MSSDRRPCLHTRAPAPRARRGHLPVGLVLVLVACGGSSETLVCDPPCPAGLECTASGCAASGADARPADLSAPGDLSWTCAPACGGATPYCNARGACVPCLEDSHCPPGQACRPVGAS